MWPRGVGGVGGWEVEAEISTAKHGGRDARHHWLRLDMQVAVATFRPTGHSTACPGGPNGDDVTGSQVSEGGRQGLYSATKEGSDVRGREDKIPRCGCRHKH